MNAIEKSNKDLRLQESLSAEAQKGEMKTKGRKHPLLKKVYLLFVFSHHPLCLLFQLKFCAPP